MKNEFAFRLAIVCLIIILVYKFGVDPMLYGNIKNEEWAKGKITREQGRFDVVVIGEEPEGIAAAVSAARIGAKTLLVSQSDNLGGVISKSLLVDLEPSLGQKGEMLNRGFYSEVYSRLGKNFTVEKYISIVNNMVKKENNLEVIYSTSIEAPIFEDNTIKGIVVNIDGEKRELLGKMFVDATREGKVLTACGVPYFMGSEDLNIKNSFLPVKLNFMIEGISPAQIAEVMKKDNFYLDVSKYETSDINIKLNLKGISIVPQGSSRAIITGLEVSYVNMQDGKAVNKAYASAIMEAEFFTAFLKKDFAEFKDIKLLKVADSFYTRESVHFIVEYVLDVNDILENKNFDNKVAIGSYSLDASKFAIDGAYIIGKPERYGIPLGCLVPLKTDNLLMIGNKASYSSLAASSAGTLSVSIAEGQAAGIVSVYSIVNNISPRDIVRQNDNAINKEIQELFIKQRFKLEDFEIKNKYEGEWSYPYIKELVHLGLVAGGMNNDFGIENEVTEKDFATLLLNGVYRLAPEKYSLEFDSSLRKYFVQDELTGEKAGEILLSINNKKSTSGNAYKDALNNGYMTKEFQTRVKGNGVLKMEDVFYLSCLNIEKYTGKEIME